MSQAPAQLRLQITSDPTNLAPVRQEVEAFCTACGFDELARGEIVLCVNEAMANITRHAYKSAKDKPIEITVTFDDATLRIEIRDWGSGDLPPLQRKPKDPLQPGGVGMVCLLSLMDTINFEPQGDGMKLVMLRKLRATPAA
jgi:anti-sigma regulatory factor (Ser/Thr protein kinase)